MRHAVFALSLTAGLLLAPSVKARLSLPDCPRFEEYALSLNLHLPQNPIQPRVLRPNNVSRVLVPQVMFESSNLNRFGPSVLDWTDEDFQAFMRHTNRCNEAARGRRANFDIVNAFNRLHDAANEARRYVAGRRNALLELEAFLDRIRAEPPGLVIMPLLAWMTRMSASMDWLREMERLAAETDRLFRVVGQKSWNQELVQLVIRQAFPYFVDPDFADFARRSSVVFEGILVAVSSELERGGTLINLDANDPQGILRFRRLFDEAIGGAEEGGEPARRLRAVLDGRVEAIHESRAEEFLQAVEALRPSWTLIGEIRQLSTGGPGGLLAAQAGSVSAGLGSVLSSHRRELGAMSDAARLRVAQRLDSVAQRMSSRLLEDGRTSLSAATRMSDLIAAFDRAVGDRNIPNDARAEFNRVAAARVPNMIASEVAALRAELEGLPPAPASLDRILRIRQDIERAALSYAWLRPLRDAAMLMLSEREASLAREIDVVMAARREQVFRQFRDDIGRAEHVTHLWDLWSVLRQESMQGFGLAEGARQELMHLIERRANVVMSASIAMEREELAATEISPETLSELRRELADWRLELLAVEDVRWLRDYIGAVIPLVEARVAEIQRALEREEQAPLVGRRYVMRAGPSEVARIEFIDDRRGILQSGGREVLVSYERLGAERMVLVIEGRQIIARLEPRRLLIENDLFVRELP